MYKLFHKITDSNSKTSVIANDLDISENELKNLISNLAIKAESISGYGNVLTYVIQAGDSQKVVGSICWKEL